MTKPIIDELELFNQKDFEIEFKNIFEKLYKILFQKQIKKQLF